LLIEQHSEASDTLTAALSVHIPGNSLSGVKTWLAVSLQLSTVKCTCGSLCCCPLHTTLPLAALVICIHFVTPVEYLAAEVNINFSHVIVLSQPMILPMHNHVQSFLTSDIC